MQVHNVVLIILYSIFWRPYLYLQGANSPRGYIG